MLTLTLKHEHSYSYFIPLKRPKPYCVEPSPLVTTVVVMFVAIPSSVQLSQTSLEASTVIVGINPRLSLPSLSILGSYIILKSYFQFVTSSYQGSQVLGHLTQLQCGLFLVCQGHTTCYYFNSISLAISPATLLTQLFHALIFDYCFSSFVM